MNLCSKGKELLMELKRSEWLPPFNEDNVRQMTKEIEALHHEILRKLNQYEEIGEITYQQNLHIGIFIHHRHLLRNKRYLLAYLNYRMSRIKNLRWETGTVIPEHLQPKLCQEEMHFFTSYDQLLTDYMAPFDMDLTMGIEPPKDLFIEVRVLKDCGDVLTENGTIRLDKNSTHFLLRTDVEHLIRQGLVEQINY